MSDDLWLPTPTVMDATRHTVRGCWRPGENWRGVGLVNAILDAGEIRIMGTHTTGMSENELPGTPNCMDMLPPHADAERPRAGKGAGYRNLRDDIDHLPTPTSNEWNGGTMVPERRAAMGHAVTVADWAEKSDDIDILPEARLFATPNCMDAIAPRDGAALERVLRRGDRDGSRRDSTGNLREDVMTDDVDMMPTPRASDVKGRNQRNDQTCMTGAVEQGPRAIPAPGPYHGGLWGLDDGRSGCPAVPPPVPRRRPAACAAGSGRMPTTPHCSNRTGSPATPRSTRIRKPGWTSRCATACSRSGVKPTGG
uniref:hypothetical protein n=1 Tax=Bifidobacterium longum TaxID=216816 RepID=UPI00359C2EC3